MTPPRSFERFRRVFVSAIALAFAVGACRRGFQVRDYPSPQTLYVAGMEQFNQGKWKNAVTALDQVVVLLGPSDTLLPRAHFYLAQAHEKRGHYLLASKSFEDLYRGFGDDTLADDALLGMADAESRLWRRPDLDPEHGRKASEAYGLLPRLYPASPLIERAQQGARRLAEMFGRKDFDIGMGLLRRKADISALIYFKAALDGFPGTKAARDAGLKMVEVYRTLKYTDDLAETCTTLKSLYATDGSVRQLCGASAVDSAG